MLHAASVLLRSCILCRAIVQIELPSNIATLLALFGGSLRMKLHSRYVRTNRAIVLTSSRIRSMTRCPPNRASLGLVILVYRNGKYSVLHTSWVELCISLISAETVGISICAVLGTMTSNTRAVFLFIRTVNSKTYGHWIIRR